MSMINNLPDPVLATIYLNAITIMLLVGILVLYSRLQMHDVIEKRMYSIMVWMMIFMSMSYIVETCLDERVLVLAPQGYLIEGSIHDIYLNVFCLTWILYAKYRMYRKIDYIKRKLLVYCIPFLTLLVLNLLDLFIPVFICYGDDGLMHVTSIYIVQDIIRYGYMFNTILQLNRVKKQGITVRFFSVTPLLICTVVGLVVHVLTPSCYTILSLGMAAGLTLLYAEVANEQSFCDIDTKFFNRSYLNYIFELVSKGRYSVNSIMSFKVDDPGKMTEFSELLRKQLPSECEPVRIMQDEIIVLSKVDERAPLFMVTEDVRAVVDEYNESHTDSPMDVKIGTRIKKRKERGTGFLLKEVEGYL
ncbi:MAG: hypothetical protein K6B14_02410 [Lachnospiraceae bacterium]|nr:hypothetical protein [Lachnospiraceae bacterium]